MGDANNNFKVDVGSSLLEHIKFIYRLFEDNRADELGLFRVDTNTVHTPISRDTLSSLFSYRSSRENDIVKQSVLVNLAEVVKAAAGYRGINHIGFCYKVESREHEVKRIARIAHANGRKVYREVSSDEAAWVFVGDISEITDPLLEFLPHEGQPRDKWADYWLPHIQFDINTGLSPEEIESMVKEYIHKPFTPYSIKIDGITYIQRVNLGCIDGVNLMLDLSTNNRDINYRKNWEVLA